MLLISELGIYMSSKRDSEWDGWPASECSID